MCLADANCWPPIAAVLLDVNFSLNPGFPFSDSGTVVHIKEVSITSVAVRDTKLVVVVRAEEGGTVVTRVEADNATIVSELTGHTKRGIRE